MIEPSLSNKIKIKNKEILSDIELELRHHLLYLKAWPILKNAEIIKEENKKWYIEVNLNDFSEFTNDDYELIFKSLYNHMFIDSIGGSPVIKSITSNENYSIIKIFLYNDRGSYADSEIHIENYNEWCDVSYEDTAKKIKQLV